MMNKISKAALAAITAIILIGFLANNRKDYSSDVISQINENAKASIMYKLGPDATDTEIAREYLTNKDFYDAQ